MYAADNIKITRTISSVSFCLSQVCKSEFLCNKQSLVSSTAQYIRTSEISSYNKETLYKHSYWHKEIRFRFATTCNPLSHVTCKKCAACLRLADRLS